MPANSTTHTDCWSCAGSGFLRLCTCADRPDLGPMSCRHRPMRCEVCDGNGTLEEEAEVDDSAELVRSIARMETIARLMGVPEDCTPTAVALAAAGVQFEARIVQFEARKLVAQLEIRKAAANDDVA